MTYRSSNSSRTLRATSICRVGAKVTVTLEIEAVVPSGAPDHVVRTVTENSRTLKFTNQGFEKE